MRRSALKWVGLALTALAVAAACVGAPPSFQAGTNDIGDAPPEIYDPVCGAIPSDFPPEKAALVAQGCAPNTMPPIAGTPVPWLDAPYGGPQITPTPTVDVMATYPACDPARIELGFEGWSPDFPSTFGWIVARTTGPKACYLQGLASVEVLDRAGSVLATGIQGDGPLGPALLQPGLPAPTVVPRQGPLGPTYTPGYGYETVWLNFPCGSTAPDVASLRASLPGTPATTLPVPPATQCDTDGATALIAIDGNFESVDGPPPALLAPSWLDVIPVLPAQAVVGQPMDFVIALHNRNELPISLEPCPVYTIQVSILDASGHADAQLHPEYTLNCGSLVTIEPGEFVAFRMRFEVPADAPAGDSMVLWWWFGTSDYPQAMQVKEPIRLVASGD
jgi:hypothetical protein